MEQFIQISKINDFIFCPKSIYFHGIYEDFCDDTYKATPQKVGSMAHESIESGKYTTSKNCIQAMPIYSEKYSLVGKIDTYLIKEQKLVERKFKVNKIYDGYRHQLYAQKFCLEEMGYRVKSMYIHSLSDNKRYEIELPSEEEVKKFEKIIEAINNFFLQNDSYKMKSTKCNSCIYRELCQ